jgi:hypothetical protein
VYYLTIAILDSIHRPVFTQRFTSGSCLHVQVEAIQMVPIGKANLSLSLSLRTPAKVRATLRLTVSQSVRQSVCLDVEPALWTFDEILLPFQEFGSGICCPLCGGPSLTRGHTSRSRSYFTTDSQSVSMSWYRAPLWDLRPDITSSRNIAV